MPHVRLEQDDVDSTPLDRAWDGAGLQDSPHREPNNNHSSRTTYSGGHDSPDKMSYREFYKQITWNQIIMICTVVAFLIGILVLNSHVNRLEVEVQSRDRLIQSLNRSLLTAKDRQTEALHAVQESVQSEMESVKQSSTSANSVFQSAVNSRLSAMQGVLQSSVSSLNTTLTQRVLQFNARAEANQQQIEAMGRKVDSHDASLTHLNRTVAAVALGKDVEKNAFLDSLYRLTQRGLKGQFKTNLHAMLQSHPEIWQGMPQESIVDILGDDGLQVDKEREVYDALMKWVDGDQIVRGPQLAQLFNVTVRWEYLEEAYLTATVRLNPLVQNDTEALAAIDFWRTKSGIRQRRDGSEVLVLIGGWNGGYTSSVHIFDLSNHMAGWKAIASLNTAREDHRAVVMEGKIYVTGGHASNPMSSVERYDPTTRKWEQMANMKSAHYDHCAVVLDGKIYVAGHTAEAERYDPAINTWTSIASMTRTRVGHACAVYGGKIYAFGGSSVEARDSSEVYDPAADRWLAISPSKLDRRYFSLISIPPQLPDAQPTLYAFGGNSDGGKLKTMDKLVGDPAQVGWQSLSDGSNMRDSRSQFGATYSVTQKKIYAVGGWAANGRSNSIESFDPDLESWTPTVATLPDARSEMALISIFMPSSVIKSS